MTNFNRWFSFGKLKVWFSLFPGKIWGRNTNHSTGNEGRENTADGGRSAHDQKFGGNCRTVCTEALEPEAKGYKLGNACLVWYSWNTDGEYLYFW